MIYFRVNLFYHWVYHLPPFIRYISIKLTVKLLFLTSSCDRTFSIAKLGYDLSYSYQISLNVLMFQIIGVDVKLTRKITFKFWKIDDTRVVVSQNWKIHKKFQVKHQAGKPLSNPLIHSWKKIFEKNPIIEFSADYSDYSKF